MGKSTLFNALTRKSVLVANYPFATIDPSEVIEWNKLLEAGSFGTAREKGWLRTEGKEYVVKDGDVMEFKI